MTSFNTFHTKSIFLEFIHQMFSWFLWNQLNIWWTNSRKIDY